MCCRRCNNSCLPRHDEQVGNTTNRRHRLSDLYTQAFGEITTCSITTAELAGPRSSAFVLRHQSSAIQILGPLQASADLSATYHILLYLSIGTTNILRCCHWTGPSHMAERARRVPDFSDLPCNSLHDLRGFIGVWNRRESAHHGPSLEVHLTVSMSNSCSDSGRKWCWRGFRWPHSHDLLPIPQRVLLLSLTIVYI